MNERSVWPYLNKNINQKIVSKTIHCIIVPSSMRRLRICSLSSSRLSLRNAQSSSMITLSLNICLRVSSGLAMNSCFVRRVYSMQLFCFRKLRIMFSQFFQNLLGVNVPPTILPSISSADINYSIIFCKTYQSTQKSFASPLNPKGLVAPRRIPLNRDLVSS